MADSALRDLITLYRRPSSFVGGLEPASDGMAGDYLLDPLLEASCVFFF
jgi:hypothetical protein